MIKPRLLSLTVILAALSLTATACEEPGTGACPGEMNGRYFNIQVSNYTAEQFEVLLNGRPIGEVGTYRGTTDVDDDGEPETVPGSTNFEEFPVCDGWELDAKGTDNSEVDTKFCSRPEFLDCGGRPDFCTMPFAICERIEDGVCYAADGNPRNYDAPPPSAVCGECGPLAWDFCD